MIILAYSDKNYEYQIESLIKSLNIIGRSDVQFVYYTVGFESNLRYPNLTKKIWPLDPKMRSFPFYKPGICLDALRTFGGNILFLDSDVVLSRRFNPDFFVHNRYYPMFSIGNWDFPFYFVGVDPNKSFPKFSKGDRVIMEVAYRSHSFFQNHFGFGNIMQINEDGSYEIKFDGVKELTNVPEDQLELKIVKDYSRLMLYYGVDKQTMAYVYSCCLSFNDKCEDFLAEWKSITENEYLNRFGKDYYPIAEETSANVTLWKREATENYGRVFVNTLYSDVIKYVEENDNLININVFDNLLQKCDDSSRIQFYHGMTDREEIAKTIQYYENRNI
jgi:hypothetical protein